MKKIKELLNSEVFKYLVFGGLTTLVFFIFKMLSFQIFKSGSISEIIGQSVAIIFAFVTNKLWVFEKSSKNTWLEFFQFVSSRLIIMGVCTLINWYFIDQNPQILTNLFHISKSTSVFVLSLFLQIMTIIVNYIVSKLVVFSQK